MASALGALATGASGCVAESVRVVSADEASRALSAARSRLGDRYLWAGQSPGGFDCSGLVLWAYAQALGQLRLRRPDGELVEDATMHQIYGWHCVPIAAEEARPGDVLSIAAEDSAVVTHGGLVEAVRDDDVAFVNASSYPGRVVSDVWPLSGSKRRQRIVGLGRLVVAERYLFGLVRLSLTIHDTPDK